MEPITLPLSAPRSTDWANGPLDTNVLHINSSYAMNAGKLNKKEKVIQTKSEICSVWVSDTGPYLYQRHALATELTDHLIQITPHYQFLCNECRQTK